MTVMSSALYSADPPVTLEFPFFRFAINGPYQMVCTVCSPIF
jgi:hypothetical protein